jgi:hypothetical protein
MAIKGPNKKNQMVVNSKKTFLKTLNIEIININLKPNIL